MLVPQSNPILFLLPKIILEKKNRMTNSNIGLDLDLSKQNFPQLVNKL